MVGVHKNVKIGKGDVKMWDEIHKDYTSTIYQAVQRKRKDYIMDICNKKLIWRDRVLFNFLVNFKLDGMIARFFRSKVMIIEKPNSFGVRIYNIDYDREDLAVHNFIYNHIKLN